MKKKIFALAIVAVLLLVGFISVEAGKPDKGDVPPSGPHYNLNIIARKNIGNGGYDNPDRHTIFVPFDDESIDTDDVKITYTQGDEFAVLDGNGFDGECTLQVPSGETKSFRVYLVSLGKPGNGADLSFVDGWVEDESGNWVYYLDDIKITGKSKAPNWQEITDIFLIEFDFYDLADVAYYLWNVPPDLFDETGYFWLINGMDKHIQLRFYPQ